MMNKLSTLRTDMIGSNADGFQELSGVRDPRGHDSVQLVLHVWNAGDLDRVALNDGLCRALFRSQHISLLQEAGGSTKLLSLSHHSLALPSHLTGMIGQAFSLVVVARRP